MKHRSIDLFIVIAITFIAIILALLIPPDNVVGRIWTLPLVLLLPGYALTRVLFTKQTPGFAEQFIFSLGLSLSIVILGGVLLNLTSFGLRTVSWVVYLGTITVTMSVIALLRSQQRTSFTSSRPGFMKSGFSFPQGLLLALAAIIVGGAIAVSILGAEHQPFHGFTQLWILPVPVHAVNSPAEVHLGVKNMEATSMEYRLIVTINGKKIKVWPTIDVNRNDTWQATLVLPQAAPGSNTKVEAMLYRQDAPKTIYRYVDLWVAT